MKSHSMSKTKSADVIRRVGTEWGIVIPKAKNLVIYKLDEHTNLVSGPALRVLEMQDGYVPFLSDVDMLDRFPKVVVDAGAIRFVCNGADVMRPGIVSYGMFGAGDMVAVSEPTGRYLAVGEARVDSDSMDDMERGMVVKNLHYISDKYWEAAKSIR